MQGLFFILQGSYTDIGNTGRFLLSFRPVFSTGYNLFQVALHELGHSLGIQHSWTEGAVMAPEYSGYIPDLTLQEDDIRAAQLLYGNSGVARNQLAVANKSPSVQIIHFISQ